jgi:hypothetical protein
METIEVIFLSIAVLFSAGVIGMIAAFLADHVIEPILKNRGRE